MEVGKGILIPKYRPREGEELETSAYAPCEFCFAMCIKSNLWKRMKTCKEINRSSDEKKVRGESAKNGKMLLPVKVGKNELYEHVLMNMKDDNVRLLIEGDALIIGYGQRQFEKYGHEKHQRNYISQNGVSATKVLWVEDDQNAIVKVPIRNLVTCDLDFLAPRRVTYALLQDEGG